VVSYEIVYSKRAIKDIPKIKAAHLGGKAKDLIDIIAENPYQTPPSYEKLVGDLQGMYSRRINVKHRLVYEVDEGKKIIKILSVWTHYDC
jgi:Txe/YoeB family toxin of toxin-antitoxin system